MKTFLLLLLLLIAGAGVFGYVQLARVDESFRGYSGDEQFVEIPAGANTRTIGERLVEAGVVRDHLTFRAGLWLSGEARRLKAGEYRFDHAMSVRDVIGKLAKGDVFTIALTFPEGLTIGEMAKTFEAQGLGTAAEFVAAANDASLVQALDPAAKDLEGYLFPDTYAVPRHTDGPKLVRLMVGRFEHVATPELIAAARARDLTVRQLVTLASIVEKETGRNEERPMVAAVYSNRLKQKMPLQCDPTVIYALQKRGHYDGNIHKDDLSIDSPYNTYRYPGLPPGPIAAPGKAALEAAVHPADVDYLYFVSRNDGTHVFARTLEEHNRNVQQFQVDYFRHHRASGH